MMDGAAREGVTLLSEWLCWARLGWFDILGRYRRTFFGPLWIVMLTTITVGSIGFVYGSLLNIPIQESLPYVAIGLVTWSWINASLLEASTSFSMYKSVILNHPLHPTSVVVRIVVRNLIVLAHNAVVVLVLLIVLRQPLAPAMLLVIPGIVIVGIVIFAVSTVVAFVCSRFQDLQQLLVSVLSLCFLVTPVIWSPGVLKGRFYIAHLNPLTHLLDLVRMPLLGKTPSIITWVVVVGLLVVCAAGAYLAVGRCRYRVPFWL